MLRQLNLLESLADAVVQFDKLIEAVLRAGLLLLRHLTKGKIVYTVHEAHLREFVVVKDEILELLDFGVSSGHCGCDGGALQVDPGGGRK